MVKIVGNSQNFARFFFAKPRFFVNVLNFVIKKCCENVRFRSI